MIPAEEAVLIMVLTAYAPKCGATGLTRAQTTPQVGITAAADLKVLPLGSRVEIEGLGVRHVHDSGRLVKGHHLDLYVSTCKEARTFGRQKRRVKIVHIPRR